MSDSRVSIEEIKQAIATTAYCIRRHRMPELLTTLMRFERYLEQRQAEGDAMDHADQCLAKNRKPVIATTTCRRNGWLRGLRNETPERPPKDQQSIRREQLYAASARESCKRQ